MPPSRRADSRVPGDADTRGPWALLTGDPGRQPRLLNLVDSLLPPLLGFNVGKDTKQFTFFSFLAHLHL